MVRLVTVLAPVAILAIWGSSYVWSCVLVLSAPGKPIQFTYKSKSGDLRLRADSYAIDWDHGTGFVEHPRIIGPDGTELASARRIDASGISLPKPNAIIVKVRDVKARLTRLTTGRFDLQDYLPERQGPPSEIPFAVNVNQADVTIVDLAGKTPYRLAAIAREIEVRGIGEKWIANTLIELPGKGNLRAEVQSLPNEGFLVRGNTPGLQLASLLEHFKATADVQQAPFLKDFRAGSLEVIGPVSVFIPKEKGFQLTTRVKAIGRDVHYLDYSAAQMFFDGQVSQNQARGQLDARNGDAKAKFNGSLIWRNGVTLGGQLLVYSPSRGALPAALQNLIPKEVQFRGARMDGWLDYRKDHGVRLEGAVEAHEASLYGQSFEEPKVTLTAGTEELRVGINGGRWAGTPVQGAVLVGLKSPTLTGALTAASVDLATVAKKFGTRGLNGKAQVSLLLGGTRTNPTAVLQGSGTGTYRVQGRLITGRFQAAGNYAGDQLRIDRFRVGTDAGSARAIGTISLKRKTLALKVDATGLRLEKLRSDLAGNINASGILNGTFSDPKFNGHALALGVQALGQDIPFASGDVQVDKNHLSATDLQIVKGTGQADGQLAMNFKTKAINGSFKAENVLLGDYFGDQALGTVTIPKLVVGGTFAEPHLTGTAYGDNLLLGGIRVDRADITATAKGSVANIDSMTAKIGDGSVSGTGKYDYDKKFGSFALKGDNLALERITPIGKGEANVTGTLNGQALATLSPSGTWRGKADGSLQNVNLNDTEFGSGNWSVAYDGEDVTGNASVGKLDRFLLLENVDYNTAGKTIAGQVSVLNGSLQDLYTSTRPFFPELSFDVKQRLDASSGDLDMTVAFSGLLNDPNVDVKLLDAHNLVLQGEHLGSLRAIFNKTGTVWNVETFKWAGPVVADVPQSALVLNQGRIDTAGDLRLDGELSNFDLKYIGLVDPNWAQLQGHASVSFLATGRTATPEIRASLESSKGSALTIGSTGESFRINLDTIHISQALYASDGSYTGGVSASGKFFYRGVSGDVAARVPLNYPLEIPDGPEITASLNFPNVDLNEVAKYAGVIDKARTSGSLQGFITIIGPKTNLALRGSIVGQAETIAFNDIQTTLKATVASVKLQDNRILLTFNTTGSAGGSMAVDLGTTLPDLRDTLDQIAKGETNALLRNPVEGTVSTTNFAVRQDSKNKDYGTYHATVNSKLAISGPAIEPTIKGRIGIADTNILLPSVFAGAGPSAEMLFNPHFDIPISLDEVARFRTSGADVSLTGDGLLTGSLAQPSFGGTLTVQSGRLNLPTARITLEEGGTLRPSYTVTSSGDSTARIDVNLEGRTAVTSIKYGDTVQRYDIHLRITGDLLADSGLNLDASSDPPDLSKDEILALLGQTDVLKTIGSSSGLSTSETENRIKQALVSIAIPTLTQGLTTRLASGLGLEYLNIDYNAIEGASLNFAKVLGKGLIIQGRRQISPTIGTRKIDYDLRLTYRLPSRNVALSRVVFSAGTDQDRPWKLGIEYGFRF